MSFLTDNEVLAGVIVFLFWLGAWAFVVLCWKAGRLK